MEAVPIAKVTTTYLHNELGSLSLCGCLMHTMAFMRATAAAILMSNIVHKKVTKTNSSLNDFRVSFKRESNTAMKLSMKNSFVKRLEASKSTTISNQSAVTAR